MPLCESAYLHVARFRTKGAFSISSQHQHHQDIRDQHEVEERHEREAAEKVEAAQKMLGYRFEDESLLLAALTHPSALEDGHEGTSYERLEFLGDSVVGLVIAEEAFVRYADVDEGGLTRIKVAMVSGEALSAVSKDLGIDRLIIFGCSETGTAHRGLHSALENVYESITGALYLDGGLETARAWVLRTLGPHLSEDYAFEPENPKSTLQEILQAHGTAPVYRITAEVGPPHDRTFHAQALARGTVLGEGEGRSKKEAEAVAAAQALDVLQGGESSLATAPPEARHGAPDAACENGASAADGSSDVAGHSGDGGRAQGAQE